MNIYVGNVSPRATEQELKSLFEEFGLVASIELVRDTMASRAYIEMPLRDEGLAAIKALNGRKVRNTPIVVTETTERRETAASRK